MLKRVSIFLDVNHLKKLQEMGTTRGLKLAQMVRLAISEYLHREQPNATKTEGQEEADGR